MDVSIIPLSTEHINAIVDIEQKSFSDPWSRVIFESLVNHPLAVYYTALNDGIVMGYAGMYVIIDEGQIQNIAVAPEYRKHGIGLKLLYHMFEYGKTRNISLYTLEVRESNLPAISLYKKLGFIQNGIRKNYYRLPTENALLFEMNTDTKFPSET